MTPARKSPDRLARLVREEFQISAKRSLLITGSRGAGKTTLLEHLCAGQALPGVCSWAERAADGTACTVWLQDRATGRCAAAGRWRQGRMHPCPEAFETLGVQALRAAAVFPGEWAAVDEVGFLEQQCPEYCAALYRLFDARRVIAVLRKQDLPLQQALLSRPDVWVVDLDDQRLPADDSDA